MNSLTKRSFLKALALFTVAPKVAMDVISSLPCESFGSEWISLEATKPEGVTWCVEYSERAKKNNTGLSFASPITLDEALDRCKGDESHWIAICT